MRRSLRFPTLSIFTSDFQPLSSAQLQTSTSPLMIPPESVPVLQGLIHTAYALAGLSLLSWFIMYFRRQAHIRTQARERAAELELTELILAQTEQEHPDGAPFRSLPRWRQRVLLRVLTGLLEQIQGAGRTRLISLTRAMGFRGFLEHALRRGRIGDRINAALVLGEFADEMAASSLTAALHDRNIGVRLTAARALLSHRCVKLTLREFLEAIRFSDKDPSIALADIFDRLPPHWHAEAIAMLGTGMPVNWRRMLVIALGRARVPGALEAVTSLLREEDPRLRAAAWIGLAELGDHSAHSMMVKGLTDSSADVRITACHCAKRLQATGCIPALRGLLQADGDWWVRYRAAQALAGLGAEGRSALLGPATGSSPQTADMGLLVLREYDAERAHAA
jgi:HEAT repeat protein